MKHAYSALADQLVTFAKKTLTELPRRFSFKSVGWLACACALWPSALDLCLGLIGGGVEHSKRGVATAESGPPMENHLADSTFCRLSGKRAA